MFHRFHPVVFCSRCFARQMHLNIPVRNDSHEQVCASGNGAYYCQKTHPQKTCASSSGISMGDLGILTWMKIVPPVPNVCERTTRGHHPIQGKTYLKHLSKTRKHNSKGSNMRYHLLTPKGRRYTTLSMLAYLERSSWQTNFFVFSLIAKRRYQNQRNPQSWHHSHRECIAWWLSINCINPIQSYECMDAKKLILN